MLTWLGHATVRAEVGPVRLLTDPVLRARASGLRRVAPPVDPAAYRDLTAVLLSHLHADHTDLPSLRLLGDHVQVVAPAGAGPWLRRHGVRDVRELHRGEAMTLGGVRVTAVEARHDARRRPLLGPSAPPCGYLVEGSWSVYFAGDTDLHPGMADLAGRVDVALLPVSGWGPTLGPGHLDPARAAEAASLIEPRIAIPIHWGTLAVPFARHRSERERIEPAVRFAAAAAQRAPRVDVVVLLPGETLTGSFRAPRVPAPAGRPGT
jgi:L-ascorbate metabolism protein UlaG (beta-lactamase superfamily)